MRSTARTKERCAANKKIPLRYQVLIVGLEEEENVEVPLQEPQVSLKPPRHQVPPMREDPFIEGDITKADLRATLMNMTQLMTA